MGGFVGGFVGIAIWLLSGVDWFWVSWAGIIQICCGCLCFGLCCSAVELVFYCIVVRVFVLSLDVAF